MNNVLNELKQRFQNGLNRKSIQSCSRWAETYRVMGKPFPGPYSFKYHPWAREMHDSESEFNVGMKAAQMGFTETVLNRAFYSIDIRGEDVLYVLPNAKPDAANFSASRFDAALDLSPHLRTLFSDVQNVGHKRAGAANMFIRGSGSKTGLKSISTPIIVIDELEEANQDNIPLAFERASGQLEADRCIWMISTPSIHKGGIHKYYLDTTQEHFFFKCPMCSRSTELVYPECLCIVGEDENDERIQESHYICKECKGTLHQEDKVNFLAKGFWVPTETKKVARGFYIPQLYSMTISPASLAKTHFKAEKDPAQETQLWNSKIGVPHETKGARVTDKEIRDCLGEYKMYDSYNRGIITMGIDVGKWLHVTIKEWFLNRDTREDINANAKSKLLLATKVENFDDLDLFMQNFGVRYAVIDANPERRMAMQFADRHYGRVSLCFYGNNVKGKTISLNQEANTITVDRTSWLDTSLPRFRNKTTHLPVDITKEWEEQMKAQVRVYKEDRDGNMVATYVSTEADHYGHSWNYAEIALPLAFQTGDTETINSRMV